MLHVHTWFDVWQYWDGKFWQSSVRTISSEQYSCYLASVNRIDLSTFTLRAPSTCVNYMQLHNCWDHEHFRFKFLACKKCQEYWDLFLHMLNCSHSYSSVDFHPFFRSWQCCCHDEGIPKYWKEWSDFAPGDCQLHASCMWSCLCDLGKREFWMFMCWKTVTALIVPKFWTPHCKMAKH